MLVALATIVGLLLGSWQGRKLGRIEGRDAELKSVCAFLLTLASTPDEETHPPRELADRIGALEHRGWTMKERRPLG
jgi:hypothetical protein